MTSYYEILSWIMKYYFFWYIFLFASFFIILFAYMHFSHKPDVLNNFLGIGALFFVFIHILVFFAIMYQTESLHKEVLPLWIIALGSPILLIGIIILISTLIVHIFRAKGITKDFSSMKEKTGENLKNMSKAKRDSYRKLSHVLIFVGMFVVWYIGITMVQTIQRTWAGMIPKDDNTFGLYITIMTEPNTIRTTLFGMGWFYFLIFFFFFWFTIILLANEMTRKTNKLYFPFNLFANVIMSEEEVESYGTYLYFAIGQLFAALLCPPMVYFAILGMSGIADLATSQVGIRIGEHHIPWNEKKTWEGTIAGTIVAAVICTIFVGPMWAMIFTLAFMAIDLFTSKPFDISDNLLIPIGCAILYVFIRYLGLEVYTFFLAYL